MKYYAHTAPDSIGTPPGEAAWQLLVDHLRGVSEQARRFARPIGLETEAELAGLLHDLGKYAARFQARLRHPTRIQGVNHWAAGAAAALERKNWSVAFAVDGHHTGMPALKTSALPGAQNLFHLLEHFRDQQRREQLTGGCPESLHDLCDCLAAESLRLPEVAGKPVMDRFAESLRARLLFSCLVDADFLDTEKHFTPGQEALRSTPGLAAELASGLLQECLTEKSADGPVNALRGRLLADCLASAEKRPGLFTLTAPTGSGKTLASLAFALRHVASHNAALAADDPHRFRRVIVVIPYTSIIEQTARVYRDLFEEAFGFDYVLEHHGAVAPRERPADQQRDAEEQRLRRARLAAENWASPLVVTTSVRFFESLFAHRPSDCRKLHNIARSVILFDEVQTLPPPLVPSLLSAVRLLTQEPYGATAVFMTATQPAFDKLPLGVLPRHYLWDPVEISSNPRAMAGTLRRTRIELPDREETIAWSDLAARLAAQPQALCVVNTTRDARELFRLLPAEGRYHLSARLCPAHRLQKLRFIRQQLAEQAPVRLVSTQLIEAGVDIDFPVAFRALGPLDSIIQTAGRCNREGHIEGACPVVVFRPRDAGSLPKGYEQVMRITESFLHDVDPETLLLPETYARYFARLYSIKGPEQATADRVFKYSEEFDFPAVADACRLIPEGTRSVLVKWKDGAGEMLAGKLERERHLTRDECREAQRHSVNLYESEFQAARAQGYVYQPAPEWDFFVWNSKYDDDLGACHAGSDDYNQ